MAKTVLSSLLNVKIVKSPKSLIHLKYQLLIVFLNCSNEIRCFSLLASYKDIEKMDKNIEEKKAALSMLTFYKVYCLVKFYYFCY